jgi:hypothetical protein
MWSSLLGQFEVRYNTFTWSKIVGSTPNWIDLNNLFARRSEKTRGEELMANRRIVQSSAEESRVILDECSITGLMNLIEQTIDGEFTCEETFDLLDEYAELVATHQDAEAIMPLVKGHLENCVDCSERYEALLRILGEPQSQSN